ncbi:MAG: TlpA family protein disulfide reductase [Bacteroidetes bacterium]|nr:MAG: TlpA family protein disulfide reductase [Bacteroidota bacterium]
MKRIVFSLLLIGFASCGRMPQEVGGYAPDFKLLDTAGKPQTLAQYKGKVVLLHFWTDFCKSCKVEFPKLQETYEATKSKDFELVAINLGQSAQVSQSFRQEFSATFPMLADTKNIMQSLYGIKVYPTNVFIDPKGRVVRIIRGWISQKQVEVLIAQHKK